MQCLKESVTVQTTDLQISGSFLPQWLIVTVAYCDYKHHRVVMIIKICSMIITVCDWKAGENILKQSSYPVSVDAPIIISVFWHASGL